MEERSPDQQPAPHTPGQLVNAIVRLVAELEQVESLPRPAPGGVPVEVVVPGESQEVLDDVEARVQAVCLGDDAEQGLDVSLFAVYVHAGPP